MPPTKQKPSQIDKIKSLVSINYVKTLLLDPHRVSYVCFLLLFFEMVLNIFIVERVNYTEIDWRAYMQEVEGFLNGTLDYSQLKGDTGPLVYPAAFVYIYSIFYWITAQGTNIHLAQYIFIVIYLLQLALTYRIWVKTAKIPAYALILTAITSYRIHSIYVLRLFNDPLAVVFFYASLNLFLENKWRLGSVFFSLGVAVKMNILLYAPALLIAYLTNLTLLETAVNLAICAGVQLILGLPFLYGNPWSYIKGSFDLGRVFEHKWTVNYRFLPREIFEHRYFHLGLLALHLGLLVAFLRIFKRYFTSYAKLKVLTDQVRQQIREKKKSDEKELSRKQKKFLENFELQLKAKNEIRDEEEAKFEDKMSKITRLFVLPFFVCNFIGVLCARSLHYQFYSWYFHSLIYLGFSTGFNRPLVFLLLGLIEFSWNVYPSTDFSSALLHICHLVMLFGLYKTMKV